VHDCGAYVVDEASRMLEPGMVVTVEPGLYFAPTTTGVPERYRGIGVRIEDDILVTGSGHENLTAAIPRVADEIEALLAQRTRREAAEARR
jgi:Xaa-Pro aminopeptidase